MIIKRGTLLKLSDASTGRPVDFKDLVPYYFSISLLTRLASECDSDGLAGGAILRSAQKYLYDREAFASQHSK